MRKGFTLIELLIVIMVIAILIGIALPRFRGMQDEASTTKAAAELRTLQTAVESWYIHRNPHTYPVAGATWETQLTTAAPEIIGAVLVDPFNGTAQYGYALSGNGRYYVIWSVGPNTSGTLTIANTGDVGGADADDIFVSNGTSGTGGF
jgi:prepilin-type N-terminal cleavage/methylation domain-containing protein